MIGTINCIYETQCGWCSRFDKKCDNGSAIKYKKTEETKCEHEWRVNKTFPTGPNSNGVEYKCVKCGLTKTKFNKTGDINANCENNN